MTDAERLEKLETTVAYQEQSIEDLNKTILAQAAEIAQQKAEHAEIKQMADAIVGAQQTEIDQMKAWRTEWYPGQ